MGEVRFAQDSTVEGDGFELPVPHQIHSRFRDSSPVSLDARHQEPSSNPSPSSKELGANLPRCAHLHGRRVTVCRSEEFALLPSDDDFRDREPDVRIRYADKFELGGVVKAAAEIEEKPAVADRAPPRPSVCLQGADNTLRWRPAARRP